MLKIILLVLLACIGLHYSAYIMKDIHETNKYQETFIKEHINKGIERRNIICKGRRCEVNYSS